MKALLLSFFAVILCYALFFDREEPLTPVDEMNYTIPTEAREQIHLSDSTVYYAKCINPLFRDLCKSDYIMRFYRYSH